MKVAVILLIVLAVVFVVVEVLGAGNNNSQQAPKTQKDQEAWAAKPNNPPSWSQTLNGSLGPFSPKLKLQTKTFNVGPNLPPVHIQVPANNPSALSLALFGHSTRKATFSVKQQQPNPCAGIVYEAPSSAGGSSSALEKNLAAQPPQSNTNMSDTTVDCGAGVGYCTALPAPASAKVKNRDEANFMILDQGGTITMKGLGTKPCTVQLD